MLITICDVPEHHRAELESLGGECRRIFNGLIDVQFQNCKMNVRDSYIKIRTPSRKSIVLCDNEFTRIYVQ